MRLTQGQATKLQKGARGRVAKAAPALEALYAAYAAGGVEVVFG